MITYTNNKGCSSTATVIVNAFPSGSITGSSPICVGNSATFSIATPTPTGGIISTAGGYRIHTFTSSGTFTVPAGFNQNVEVLVVAGGGGGGIDIGGGGGGGGVIYTSYPVSPGNITVTVGSGGAGAPAAGTGGQPASSPYTIPATNGQNSVFGTLTAFGGGFGGSSYNAYTPGATGGNGGSGGGASGSANLLPGTAEQELPDKDTGEETRGYMVYTAHTGCSDA